jgi:hypothetical protein
MGLSYGRAGRLTTLFGDFRPGQCTRASQSARGSSADAASAAPGSHSDRADHCGYQCSGWCRGSRAWHGACCRRRHYRWHGRSRSRSRRSGSRHGCRRSFTWRSFGGRNFSILRVGGSARAGKSGFCCVSGQERRRSGRDCNHGGRSCSCS